MKDPGGGGAGGAVEVDFEKGAVLDLDMEIGTVAATSPILLRSGASETPIMPGLSDGDDAMFLLTPDEGGWLGGNAFTLDRYLLADER